MGVPTSGSSGHKGGAMAITAKVQYIFGMSKWGWTETYYLTGTGNDLNSLVSNIQTTGKYRTALLAAGANLEAIRVSDVKNPQTAILLTSGAAFGGGTQLPASNPWNALLVRIDAAIPGAQSYKRSVMLRGLPTAWYAWTITNPAGAGSQIQGAALGALRTFFRSLTSSSGGNPSGWCVRASQRDRAANPAVPISSAGVTGAGPYFTVTVPLPVNFTQWQKVHISGARGPGTRGLNSDAYVTAVDPATGILTLSTRQKCPGETVQQIGKAIIYARDYIYVQMTAYTFERWVKRDTGRAFFGTAGRRGTKLC